MTSRPFTPRTLADQDMRKAIDALDDMLSGYQYEAPTESQGSFRKTPPCI